MGKEEGGLIFPFLSSKSSSFGKHISLRVMQAGTTKIFVHIFVAEPFFLRNVCLFYSN